jgi:hypothetical protein
MVPFNALFTNERASTTGSNGAPEAACQRPIAWIAAAACNRLLHNIDVMYFIRPPFRARKDW